MHVQGNSSALLLTFQSERELNLTVSECSCENLTFCQIMTCILRSVFFIKQLADRTSVYQNLAVKFHTQGA